MWRYNKRRTKVRAEVWPPHGQQSKDIQDVPTLQASLADDKAATSPFAEQVWRGVRIESRYAKADELVGMRDLVDRLEEAGVAYAVREVFCDSKSMMHTVSLRPGAQAPWAYFEAVVQAWVDNEDVTASIEGEQLSVDYLGPDEEPPARWDDPAAAVGAALVLLKRGRSGMALKVLERIAGPRS
jgi:uncharacterized protein YidB (DUF937 family)